MSRKIESNVTTASGINASLAAKAPPPIASEGFANRTRCARRDQDDLDELRAKKPTLAAEWKSHKNSYKTFSPRQLFSGVDSDIKRAADRERDLAFRLDVANAVEARLDYDLRRELSCLKMEQHALVQMALRATRLLQDPEARRLWTAFFGTNFSGKTYLEGCENLVAALVIFEAGGMPPS